MGTLTLINLLVVTVLLHYSLCAKLPKKYTNHAIHKSNRKTSFTGKTNKRRSGMLIENAQSRMVISEDIQQLNDEVISDKTKTNKLVKSTLTDNLKIKSFHKGNMSINNYDKQLHPNEFKTCTDAACNNPEEQPEADTSEWVILKKGTENKGRRTQETKFVEENDGSSKAHIDQTPKAYANDTDVELAPKAVEPPMTENSNSKIAQSATSAQNKTKGLFKKLLTEKKLKKLAKSKQVSPVINDPENILTNPSGDNSPLNIIPIKSDINKENVHKDNKADIKTTGETLLDKSTETDSDAILKSECTDAACSAGFAKKTNETSKTECTDAACSAGLTKKEDETANSECTDAACSAGLTKKTDESVKSECTDAACSAAHPDNDESTEDFIPSIAKANDIEEQKNETTANLKNDNQKNETVAEVTTDSADASKENSEENKENDDVTNDNSENNTENSTASVTDDSKKEVEKESEEEIKLNESNAIKEALLIDQSQAVMAKALNKTKSEETVIKGDETSEAISNLSEDDNKENEDNKETSSSVLTTAEESEKASAQLKEEDIEKSQPVTKLMDKLVDSMAEENLANKTTENVQHKSNCTDASCLALAPPNLDKDEQEGVKIEKEGVKNEDDNAVNVGEAVKNEEKKDEGNDDKNEAETTTNESESINSKKEEKETIQAKLTASERKAKNSDKVDDKVDDKAKNIKAEANKKVENDNLQVKEQNDAPVEEEKQKKVDEFKSSCTDENCMASPLPSKIFNNQTTNIIALTNPNKNVKTENNHAKSECTDITCMVLKENVKPTNNNTTASAIFQDSTVNKSFSEANPSETHQANTKKVGKVTENYKKVAEIEKEQKNKTKVNQGMISEVAVFSNNKNNTGNETVKPVSKNPAQRKFEKELSLSNTKNKQDLIKALHKTTDTSNQESITETTLVENETECTDAACSALFPMNNQTETETESISKTDDKISGDKNLTAKISSSNVNKTSNSTDINDNDIKNTVKTNEKEMMEKEKQKPVENKTQHKSSLDKAIDEETLDVTSNMVAGTDDVIQNKNDTNSTCPDGSCSSVTTIVGENINNNVTSDTDTDLMKQDEANKTVAASAKHIETDDSDKAMFDNGTAEFLSEVLPKTPEINSEENQKSVSKNLPAKLESELKENCQGESCQSRSKVKNNKKKEPKDDKIKGSKKDLAPSYVRKTMFFKVHPKNFPVVTDDD